MIRFSSRHAKAITTASLMNVMSWSFCMSVPNDENQDDMCSFLHAGTKTRTGAEFSAESHMYSSWATTPDSASGDDDSKPIPEAIPSYLKSRSGQDCLDESRQLPVSGR